MSTSKNTNTSNTKHKTYIESIRDQVFSKLSKPVSTDKLRILPHKRHRCDAFIAAVDTAANLDVLDFSGTWALDSTVNALVEYIEHYLVHGKLDTRRFLKLNIGSYPRFTDETLRNLKARQSRGERYLIDTGQRPQRILKFIGLQGARIHPHHILVPVGPPLDPKLIVDCTQ